MVMGPVREGGNAGGRKLSQISGVRRVLFTSLSVTLGSVGWEATG